MSIRVLDPRLDSEGEAPRMAPALKGLDGATVALLDNAKIGTQRFFDQLEAMLRSHGVRDVIRRRKPDSSRPVPREMLAEMAAADALVSAVGD